MVADIAFEFAEANERFVRDRAFDGFIIGRVSFYGVDIKIGPVRDFEVRQSNASCPVDFGEKNISCDRIGAVALPEGPASKKFGVLPLRDRFR